MTNPDDTRLTRELQKLRESRATGDRLPPRQRKGNRRRNALRHATIIRPLQGQARAMGCAIQGHRSPGPERRPAARRARARRTSTRAGPDDGDGDDGPGEAGPEDVEVQE